MKKILLALLLLLSTQAFATAIHETQINKPIDVYYPLLKKAIEDNKMHVLYEMDLLKKFEDSGYAKKFGTDFNKNNIQAIKTILICNGYVGNQVSNLDPKMMVLCPIKITLIQQGDKTLVSFVKNSDISKNDKINELLMQLDTVIINTIELTHDKYMEKAIIDGTESQFEGN